MTKSLNASPTDFILEGLEIQAVGLTTRKAHGEAAEAAFLAKVAGLGFGVAKPWGDSEHYDFIVDSGHNFWRVQVKSTQRFAESRYRVRTGGCNYTYTAAQIDFLVAYIVPEDTWYVVPVVEVVTRQNLRFYPHGAANSAMEKYREAWCQLACPRTEDGPSQVLVPRHCERVPAAKEKCPLCAMA